MRSKCLCGTIEFEVKGPLPKAYQCHCSLCRKQSGTAFNTSLMIAGHKFRWLTGQKFISSYVKDTGYRSDFCSRCGSPIPNPLRGTSYMWVPAGLLQADAPSRSARICLLAPKRHGTYRQPAACTMKLCRS